MRKVVVNTTPIIALADIGQLSLLQKLYGEIVIPEAVDLEVLSEPARSILDTATWIKVVLRETFENRYIDLQNSRRFFFGYFVIIKVPYEGTVSLILNGGPENANQQKRNHKRND